MGSELKMNTSFYPQTDGQTERVNLVIQQFLNNYVVADQQDWVDHLELAEFCYNNSDDALLSPLLNPLEGSTMCSCRKLGLGGRSRLPAL